jgi:putative transposase
MESAQQRTEDEESEKPSKKRRKNPSAKKPSNKPPTGKAIHYRLYPTSDQKQLLQQWFGVARWTYNKCLNAIKNLNKKSKKALRAHCLNKEAFDRDDMTTFKWALDVTYDVLEEAMSDVLKAYKSNLAKSIKFRSKNDKQQFVAVLNKQWLKKKGVFSFLRTIESAEALPYDLVYDLRLIKTRTGHYYYCVPKPLEARSESQSPVFNKIEEQGCWCHCNRPRCSHIQHLL